MRRGDPVGSQASSCGIAWTATTGAKAHIHFHVPYAALEGPLFHGSARIV